MKVTQISYSPSTGWNNIPPGCAENTLILAFADRPFGNQPEVWNQLREKAGNATVLACSTAGGILGPDAHDNDIVGAVAEFEKTRIQLVSTTVENAVDSFNAGVRIAQKLPANQLTAVFVLSPGLSINGSELVKGISSVLPEGVTLSGGLAGDGANFQSTWVLESGVPQEHCISAIGFYGPDIHFAYGSQGGWDKFGVERRVTKSEGSVLYELDGKPALKLYKEYLGERASELPAAGLLFPLALRPELQSDKFLVRTILQVDEKEQSLVFAGDVPIGSYAQLMRANFDRLIQGAANAAQMAKNPAEQKGDALAVAISCVGRKAILGGRAEDELDAALAMMPSGTKQVGFYSYGEVAPNGSGGPCQFHNQTMTITRFYEG
jgi:hypothetical protein